MAKVLIDIPNRAYRRISEKSEVLYSEMIILNGTPLTDLTNGEVMQKIFPQMNIISASPFSVYIEMKECNQFNNLVSFDVDWWNAKWGE